jgi:CheY-like chemotaxis protein
MMPKVNGIEFLKKLREQEAFRELPVVVLTNACVPAFVDQAKKAGANYVMDKSKATPVTVAELLCSGCNIVAEKPAAAS